MQNMNKLLFGFPQGENIFNTINFIQTDIEIQNISPLSFSMTKDSHCVCYSNNSLHWTPYFELNYNEAIN